ncbi:MAG: cobalamin biosynthesis protein CobD [Methanomicrobiales archaeon]|nr:cobalamin biosynthesis protein CobD [Methanomicrobiales archaeon]
MAYGALVLWAALLIDRLTGDPRNSLHPTAYLGRFIGWWGRPDRYPASLQRAAGTLGAIVTAGCYALPFLLVDRYAPLAAYLVAAPFLLKICFAWRCLEDHVAAVTDALAKDGQEGQKAVQLLVSRNTAGFGDEAVLSAAYESMAENLVDSIVAPLFFFMIGGLAGAAFYRAVNTMDAMLGYTDHRKKIGWFPARLDDVLNFIPARVTGALLLLWFWPKGRFSEALQVLRRDARRRPGYNGGIPMAVIAGGVGIRFEKPGRYVIGDPARSLADGGADVVGSVRGATLLAAVLFSLTLAFIAPPAL